MGADEGEGFGDVEGVGGVGDTVGADEAAVAGAVVTAIGGGVVGGLAIDGAVFVGAALVLVALTGMGGGIASDGAADPFCGAPQNGQKLTTPFKTSRHFLH